MLYSWSHFSLLCTVQGEGPASPPLLPLCTRGGPLMVRFPSVAEEQHLQLDCDGGGGGYPNGGGPGSNSSADQHLELLQRYMDAERLFNGSLGVRLAGGWAVG